MDTLKHLTINPDHAAVLALLSLLAIATATAGLPACGSDPATTTPSPRADATAASPSAPSLASPPPTATPSPTATPTPLPTPAPTPTPLPTATPKPSPTHRPTPISSPPPATTPPEARTQDGPTITPGVTWNDVFITFTKAERECIRGRVDETRLAEALSRPFPPQGPTEPWQVEVLDCVNEETAGEVFLAGMLAYDLGNLTEAQQACLEALVANTDIPALAAATLPAAPPEQALSLLAFSLGLLTCVPELADSAAAPTGGG